MLLSKLIDKYELANDLKASSVNQLRWTVRALERELGRPADVGDLTADAINTHLLALKNAGLAASTIRGRRVNLVTLWKYARRCHYVLEKPVGIRKIKVPQLAPRAWTQDEVQHLLTVIGSMQGTVMTGHKAAAYWRAYLLVGWDTGLRRCDLIKLSAKDVSTDGLVVITQEKTGEVITCRLRPETAAALAVLEGEGLSWEGRTEVWYRHFKRVLLTAGLVGKPKWIRRSSATAVELEFPGMGGRHLGHKTPGLAERHYLDPVLLARNKPQPPSLG